MSYYMFMLTYVLCHLFDPRLLKHCRPHYSRWTTNQNGKYLYLKRLFFVYFDYQIYATIQIRAQPISISIKRVKYSARCFRATILNCDKNKMGQGIKWIPTTVCDLHNKSWSAVIMIHVVVARIVVPYSMASRKRSLSDVAKTLIICTIPRRGPTKAYVEWPHIIAP